MFLFGRKRLVRLHLKGDDSPSIEGIFVGMWAGHYVLAKARHIASEEQSFGLDGETCVPREEVLYMQRVG